MFYFLMFAFGETTAKKIFNHVFVRGLKDVHLEGTGLVTG